MGKVAREVVEKAGVNVEELLKKLIRAASAGFTTYYYCTILRVNSIGFDGEGLKEITTGANAYPANVYPEDMPVLKAQLAPLEVFPVRVEDGRIFVQVAEEL